MKYIIFLVLPLLTLLASCSSTPTSRIQDNPEVYEALSAKHKELASQGRITKGMPKSGVFLAMGNPDSRSEINRDDVILERWGYNVLTPVYSTGGYSSFNYGHRSHRYGSRRRYGGYGGYSQSIHYIPRPGTAVDFTEGKVSGWNIARGRY